MINQQPPEKPSTAEGDSLDVHSVFATIQGEGPFSGHRAIFVRLAGCNLQCPGCDTEYTQGRRRLNIYDLADEVRALACHPDPRPLVVITGGEPLRQPIGWFVRLMLRHGYPVQIESNGTCAPDNDLVALVKMERHHHALDRKRPTVTLIVSPKTVSIHPMVMHLASAFKYVLDEEHVDPADGLPTVALMHDRGKGVARPRPGTPVYLTPMDEQCPVSDAANRRAVAASCMRHGHIANLQIHKLLEIP